MLHGSILSKHVTSIGSTETVGYGKILGANDPSPSDSKVRSGYLTTLRLLATQERPRATGKPRRRACELINRSINGAERYLRSSGMRNDMILPVFKKRVPKSQRLLFAKLNDEIFLLSLSNFYV